MSIVSITAKDGIDDEFAKLLKKTRNLKPAMHEVELLVMRPLKSKAWHGSGLASRSGELEKSVQAWHGKKSTGFGVHRKPGRNLIIPKAVTHTMGARRAQYRKKRQYRVRGYHGGGRAVSGYTRRNAGAPWGNIKARPFIPSRLSTGDIQRVIRILERYIHV